MPPTESTSASAPEPVVSLDDPRAVQILTTEHWSLLASRSLAYNEAFARGGMFLAPVGVVRGIGFARPGNVVR